MSSSLSAPASSSRSCKYDVFLSFRGEDTRKTFVDHLYLALKQHLIRIYMDTETLPRGESIRLSLFKAIEESQIAVIIFSKNYAKSSWCLEELAHIMKCKDERELIVMPVFYDVDPSEVRKQKGDFGKGFAQQYVENSGKTLLWRNALVDASNIAGWEPKHIANGHESKAIMQIVNTILDKLTSLNSDVDEVLVGMTNRLQDLKSLLELGSGGVRMVGIWGVGGSGKTTLASSLYNEILFQFQACCIVDNIRVESSKHGLKTLQEKLLSCVLKTQLRVQSVEEGKRLIKSRLCHSNVLVLLDDVNDLDQLEALVGSHNWFGSGSRIIITTRDEHLLRAHKVDEVGLVKLLSNDEAIQLFKRHAYNEKDPIEDYETLSLSVVSYAAGLPLALKVIGRFLYDKDNVEWISALNKLKDIPDLKVIDVLKTSYDGLESYYQELFLDIACFWKGKNQEDAMEILEACGYHHRIGIKVLRQKALISIVDGHFDMHDLIQQMGHYIVRGKHLNNPEKHSRLWKQEEIDDICFRDTSMINDKVEAIEYTNYDHDHSSRFCMIVSNMKKLKYLVVNMDDEVDGGGPTFLSNELRYTQWYGYPASPLPDSFQPMKLVVLRLITSMQKEVWKGCKHLPHLKVLHLSGMKKLLNTPDFDGLPCLQKLTLSFCYELEEIHTSLGHHKSLEYITVSRCYKLRLFPTIVHMKNLKSLEIEDCLKILEFPEIQENMENMVKLSLRRVGIEVLPSSIGERCTNLICLHLCYLKNLKSIEFNFDTLKHLKDFKLKGSKQLEKTRFQLFHQFLPSSPKLDLSACHFKDGEIPTGISELSNIQELDLSGNHFSRLDFSLSQLSCLKLLNLSHCVKLLELPELPSSLTILKADCCTSLTTFGNCHKNCKLLCQVSIVGGGIINDGRRLLQFLLEGKAIENGHVILQLLGVEIPNGFTPPLARGSRCRLQLPENWCNDFCGFLMCAALSYDWSYPVRISMNHVTSGMVLQHDVVWDESNQKNKDYMRTWVGYVSFGSLRQTAWWDQTYKALEFHIETGIDCSGFGVRLVDKKSRDGLNERSTYCSSHYAPKFEIQHDSTSALTISLGFKLNPFVPITMPAQPAFLSTSTFRLTDI